MSVLLFELTGASKEENIRNKCDCDAICGGSVVRLIGLDIYIVNGFEVVMDMDEMAWIDGTFVWLDVPLPSRRLHI